MVLNTTSDTYFDIKIILLLYTIIDFKRFFYPEKMIKLSYELNYAKQNSTTALRFQPIRCLHGRFLFVILS